MATTKDSAPEKGPEETVSPEVLALRKRRLEIEAERAQIAEKRAARELVEAEKAANLDLECSLRDEKFIEEYGVPLGVRGQDWQLVSTWAGAAIIKKPAHVVYRHFADLNKVTSATLDDFARKCLVYPPAKEYDAICMNLPGFTALCANAASDLGGITKKQLEGK